MIRILYLAMLTLPLLAWHLGKNATNTAVPILNQDVKNTANFATNSENTGKNMEPYLIAGRNERIKSCSFLGNCKD